MDAPAALAGRPGVRTLAALVTISPANIIGTGAGQLSNASGFAVVPPPPAGFALEFVSGLVILKFSVAAYAGGGTVNFRYLTGSSPVSTGVAAADSVAGAADKAAIVQPAIPTSNQMVAGSGINLTTTVAFTNPGTAAGVVLAKVVYRIHALS